MRVLMIDDNDQLAQDVRARLAEEGFTIDVANRGHEGEDRAATGTYDAIILDWMLTDTEGIHVCSNLRKRGVDVPILMLTSLDQVDRRIAGLDAGADDYLTKPFDFGELAARLRSIARRRTGGESSKLSHGTIEMDLLRRQVICGGDKIELTTREFDLLEFFLRRQDRVLSRGAIYENVWDMNYVEESNVLEVYVSRLRNKLGDAGKRSIKTIPSAGYMMSSSDG